MARKEEGRLPLPQAVSRSRSSRRESVDRRWAAALGLHPGEGCWSFWILRFSLDGKLGLSGHHCDARHDLAPLLAGLVDCGLVGLETSANKFRGSLLGPGKELVGIHFDPVGRLPGHELA